MGWMGVLAKVSELDTFRWRGWLPVPLYLSALPFVDPERWDPWELSLGAALTALGLALRVLARLELGRSSDTRRLHCQRLVTDGIYAWLRNPIYVGNLAIAVGLAVLAGTGWFALALAVLLRIHYGRVVRVEERHLAQAFPARHAQYCHRVGRFLPRAIPQHARERLARVRREGRIWAGIGLALAALIALRHF